MTHRAAAQDPSHAMVASVSSFTAHSSSTETDAFHSGDTFARQRAYTSSQLVGTSVASPTRTIVLRGIHVIRKPCVAVWSVSIVCSPPAIARAQCRVEGVVRLI